VNIYLHFYLLQIISIAPTDTASADLAVLLLDDAATGASLFLDDAPTDAAVVFQQ
jgi:hypothetical protein